MRPESESTLGPKDIKGMVPKHLSQPFASPGFVKMPLGYREEGLAEIINQSCENKSKVGGEYTYAFTRNRTANEEAYEERLNDWYKDLPSRADPAKQREYLESNGVYEDFFSEYKIHFQVKIEYIPYFLNKLLWLTKNDPVLIKAIHTFKLSGELPMGGILPNVVVYVHPNRPTLGQELQSSPQQNIRQVVDRRLAQARANMITALARLKYYFENDSGVIGADVTPRCNTKINPLLYVAQSGGDLKGRLADENIDYFFDREQNYSFRKGEQAPTEAELQVALG